MKIALLFLRIGLLRYDTIELRELVRGQLVTKLALLQEEDMEHIDALTNLSFGSAKWTLAFLVGLRLGSLFWSIGLLLLVTLPSFVLIGVVLYYAKELLGVSMLEKAMYGMMPVIAALFFAKAIDYLKQAKEQLHWFSWLNFLGISILLVVVLNLPVAVAIMGMLIFFLCFLRGGSKYD